MIKGLEKCSASSALFVFSQDQSGDYQLALGSKGKLVGRAVEALRENGLEAKWVYVCAWMKSNGFGELFQTPISAEALRDELNPTGFFGVRNPPGLIVSPLVAINLSAAGVKIDAIIVLRDAKPRVFKTDVVKSLGFYTTVHEVAPSLLFQELLPNRLDSELERQLMSGKSMSTARLCTCR
jgi:hypothetical protein